MQYVLFAAATAAFILILFTLPETSHPGERGVDKAPESSRNKFVLLNPLDSLMLLRSPNLLAVVSCDVDDLCSQLISVTLKTIIGTVTLLTDYG
jgi:hypothetical protein